MTFCYDENFISFGYLSFLHKNVTVFMTYKLFIFILFKFLFVLFFKHDDKRFYSIISETCGNFVKD